MKPDIQTIENALKQTMTNEEVQALLEPIKVLSSQRRYGLVWEEPTSGAYDSENVEQVLKHHYPFLKEEKNKIIEKDLTKPNNLLIEGDNLHALQALQYTHKGQVDVIYIDPPYNTGNRDFVYNDRFVDAEDSWRHSSWLSFMNKRLRLARELMTDDGVIFISIDDNEQAQLKLLCDQVFGEQNFVENLIWEKSPGKNDSNTFRNMHEYVLVYSKNKINTERKMDNRGFRVRKEGLDEVLEICKSFTKEKDKYEYPEVELEKRIRSHYRSNPELKGIKAYNKVEEGTLKIFTSADLAKPDAKGYRYDVIHPQTLKPCKMPKNGWSRPQYSMDNLISENRVLFGKTESIVPRKKNYLEEMKSEVAKSVIIDTSSGKKTLDMVIHDHDFSYPKPIALIKYLISLIPNKNITLLDFFAGSGTTGHAVMELNKEDGGSRQFILCTNNEVNEDKEIEQLVELGHVEAFSGRKRTKKHKAWVEEFNQFKESETYTDFLNSDTYKDLGIARAVTYERLKRVINGYTTPKGKDVEGIANNLRYFTVELKKASQDEAFDSYRLIKDTVDIIRIKEDLYTDERWKILDGIDVVHLEDKQKVIRVVLDADVTDEDVEAILQTFEEDGKEHKIYTSYTGSGYLDYGNVKHERLPEEILKAIRRKQEH